ncbi:putative glucooligosaccharide oxidase [Hypoxylon trugodes]|uniref:putative glucooligosaccharide oxidase n=1 Tax=Hypoxylon trugodes TaxID=326681 RepID=UPI0021A2222B|nr:putative glucooligosaccharide oxidase [Hypoxylon trugodes]KAI1385212.1 putative glucooligosaccharide oxidase [Hypoxylon trugodes]
MANTNVDAAIRYLTDLSVPYITPGDLDWDIHSATYNLRVPVIPAIIVFPDHVGHISSAVFCAGEHGLKVQARSGGHSYASHSNGGANGSMVIDLQKMQYFNSARDPVLVRGGMRLGNLAHNIYTTLDRKRALPHGSCAGVGIGGHFTHGGYGFFSRAWGLAMDRISALSVVTASGACVYASKEENADISLTQAMRGAADSFGIVKSFFLDTVPAPERVVHWDLFMHDANKSIDSVVDTFQRVQNFTHNASIVDRNLGFNITLSATCFAIGGTYLGSSSHLAETIIPALHEGMQFTPSFQFREVDWPASLKLLNQGVDITTPVDDECRYNFFAKSVVVPEPGFTEEALRSFFTFLLTEGADAPVSYWILVDFYGGADSQISNKDIDFNAFAHRDALWVVQLYGFVENDEIFPPEGIDFVNGLANSITTHLPRYGAYSNYADPSLSRHEAHTLYYGPELYTRLKAIKQKWDPKNVFENPQSI